MTTNYVNDIEKNMLASNSSIYKNVIDVFNNRGYFDNTLELTKQIIYIGSIANVQEDSVTISFESNNNTKEYCSFDKKLFNFEYNINDLVVLKKNQSLDGITCFYFEKYTKNKEYIERENEILSYLRNNMDEEDDF